MATPLAVLAALPAPVYGRTPPRTLGSTCSTATQHYEQRGMRRRLVRTETCDADQLIVGNGDTLYWQLPDSAPLPVHAREPIAQIQQQKTDHCPASVRRKKHRLSSLSHEAFQRDVMGADPVR